MITHQRRFTANLWIIFLFLFLLTLGPLASGQEDTTTADLPALVKELKDKKAKVRATAVLRLTALGKDAKPAIPVLVEALRDSDAKVRYRAAIALSRLWSGLESGPEIEAAVPALLKLLEEDDQYTRERAILALRMIGPAARAALPELKKIMRDRNDPQWISAFSAVDDIERPATDDVSALAALLKDKDASVRIQAAERLALMGMKAVLLSGGFKGEAAIPALVEALKDSETKVRYHSLSALSDLMYNAEPPDLGAIVPAVTELLKDADSGTRWHAAHLLGQIGPRASAAVPLLIEVLSDEDETVRSYAAYAIGKIGADSKVAGPPLIKLLKDRAANVRESAANTLAKVDPGSANVVVPSLVEDLKHENPEFRGRAARALEGFGPQAKPAVPLLVQMLKTEDDVWRDGIVETLEKIGPGVPEVVPALRGALNDRLGRIRLAAAIALVKIAPETKSEIEPSLLKQAQAKIEKEAAGVRPAIGIYNPPPGTKWDEAYDLLSRGSQFYREGKLDAAIASFTEALEIDPLFPDAYHWRATVHRRRGDYSAAISDFTRAIDVDSRSNETHFLARGATHIDRRAYDAAIADFTAIIEANPYNADASYGRGLAYHYKGNYDASIADYDRALKIVPPNTKALGARGAAKLAQGRFADALADFNEAIKADPNSFGLQEGIGDAYAGLGEMVKARAAWIRALSHTTESKYKDRVNEKLNRTAKL